MLKIFDMKVKIAKEMGLPTVATCDSHYLEPEDYIIQEIAWCISDGNKLTDPQRRKYDSTEFYVKNPAEMSKLFHDLPEAIKNTSVIADSIEEYKLEYGQIQPKYDTALNVTETKDLLKKHAMNKFHTRYPKKTPELLQRVEYELKIIDQKGTTIISLL
jgi:DNA polymerase-3 subunit alpha